jgi:hypothetical protein
MGGCGSGLGGGLLLLRVAVDTEQAPKPLVSGLGGGKAHDDGGELGAICSGTGVDGVSGGLVVLEDGVDTLGGDESEVSLC